MLLKTWTMHVCVVPANLPNGATFALCPSVNSNWLPCLTVRYNGSELAMKVVETLLEQHAEIAGYQPLSQAA